MSDAHEPSPGQLELALLRANLHSFERIFYCSAGLIYAELDRARGHGEESRRDAEECVARLQCGAAEPEALHRLHRELARAFHPDRASDQARRLLREPLMTEVNLAFQEKDLPRLTLLQSALDHDENGDAARQLAEVSRSPLAELFERAEYAKRHDTDLLEELAQYLQQSRGEARAGNLVQRALCDIEAILPVRQLAFPPVSMGELSMRDERDIDAPLTPVGPASWGVRTPFGQALMLRLSPGCSDLTPLEALDPEDLHGLIDEWPGFVNLNDEQLRPLARFRSLEELRLGRTAITGRVFDCFPALHELRVLILDETRFDDAGLLRLEESVWLQRLDLSRTQVTGAGLTSLRNMSALRELNLYGTSVDDSTLAVLARIPGLRSLNLGLTRVTDAVAEHLSHLHSLEVLNLGGTQVTDAMLDSLMSLPALHDLVLWETAISPGAMEKLKKFPALRYVDVDETAVSAEAKADFHAARRDVRLPSDIRMTAEAEQPVCVQFNSDSAYSAGIINLRQ